MAPSPFFAGRRRFCLLPTRDDLAVVCLGIIAIADEQGVHSGLTLERLYQEKNEGRAVPGRVCWATTRSDGSGKVGLAKWMRASGPRRKTVGVRL